MAFFRVVRSFINVGMVVVIITAAAWIIGFATFVFTLPSENMQPQHHKADGIVVLTGDRYRIEKGLDLLQKEKASHLLITGVHPGTSSHDLVVKRGYPAELCNKINIDHKAQTTAENAEQTAYWAKKLGIHSVLLVTSYYHMPRSMILFKNNTENISITPYPVFPDPSKSLLWRGWVLVDEYHKFMTTYLFYGVRS